MRATTPEAEWAWLRTLIARLGREVLPASKAHRLVDPLVLIDLGTKLMDTAQQAHLPGRDAMAIQFRDGLMIALLAYRPLRRANLIGIRVGRHLVRVGDGYILVFGAEETKNQAPLEAPFPTRLLPYLERYLTKVRPRFPGADLHDGLWPTEKGVAMGAGAAYVRVRRRTLAALGITVNLHSFRDSAATLLAESHGEGLNNARDILGHARLETTERYYIHANRRKAVHAHQNMLRELRARLDPKWKASEPRTKTR